MKIILFKYILKNLLRNIQNDHYLLHTNIIPIILNYILNFMQILKIEYKTDINFTDVDNWYVDININKITRIHINKYYNIDKIEHILKIHTCDAYNHYYNIDLIYKINSFITYDEYLNIMN